jgi:tight adherence protein C
MSPAALLVVFFIFVAGAVTAAGYVFVLRPSRTEPGGTIQIPQPLGLNLPDSPTAAQTAVLDMFRLVGEAMPGGQAESFRMKLAAAGYRWQSAASIFVGIKCGSALLFATAAVWAAMLYSNNLADTLLPAICGVGFGYLIPDRVLTKLAASRAGRLRRALPAALDLMVLAVESGQGLDAAMLETSRGLRITHPDLASEFVQLQLELRADATRMDALRNFAARTGDQELRKFAHLLMETDRFGSSLGPALRTHAKYLRTRFRQKAQEQARKVGIKLIFPIFFLIFPSVLLVTLGPAVMLMSMQFKNMLGQ